MPEIVGKTNLRAIRSDTAATTGARLRLSETRALWFGPRERPLFGWYHPAVNGTPRAGVVLCSPFGHEAMATHRGYARFAERFAAAGFASLRFDYDGAGDSAGDPRDPARFTAWLESIRHAREALTSLSGSERSVLFGMRFGALLALCEGSENPADALIALAPPASGRALVREMQALHALKLSRLTHLPAEPEMAIVGFPLDLAARSALSEVDYRKLARAPAPHALIIQRDDLPSGEAKLAQRLRELGTETTLLAEPGYEAFAQDDAVKPTFPERIADATVTWLEAAFPTKSGVEPAPRMTAQGEPLAPVSSSEHAVSWPASSATPEPDVHEEVVQFDGMFGVLSSPTHSSLPQRTAVALLNIGANHHVGSNRLYVNMARTWSALGFSVLRVDFPGIGDSPVAPGRRENDVYSPHLVGDTKSVIDFLVDRGAEKVVLLGLCSGAYAAFHAAVADERVSDVVLINLLTFHWVEGDSLEIRSRRMARSTLFYKRAMFKKQTWQRLLRGDVNVTGIARELSKRAQRRVQREVLSRVAGLAAIGGRTLETSDVERGFKRLDQRGTGCLAIYGSNDSGIDVIEEHLGPGARALRRSQRFRMLVLDGPDHTFTPLWTQSHLIELVGEHLLARYGANRGGAALRGV